MKSFLGGIVSMVFGGTTGATVCYRQPFVIITEDGAKQVLVAMTTSGFKKSMPLSI